MALIGYARVSTADQSLELQLEQLQAAGCEKIFREKESGASAARPELERCLEFVREGDVLIVTRLDRLGRSVVDLRTIVSQLQAKGCHFRCLLQPMDTTSPEGKLMLNILGAFAEFELEIRRERQREGIARAKAEGKYRGGQSRIDAAQIVKLRQEGLGAGAIARQMGISRRSVYRTVPDGWGPAPFTQQP